MSGCLKSTSWYVCNLKRNRHILDGTILFQVSNSSAEFGVGNQNYFPHKNEVLDYTYPTYFGIDTLATRLPARLPNYGNLVRVLPPEVWVVILALIIVMSLVFMIINKTYAHIDNSILCSKDDKLTKTVSSPVDFFIKTFSTITEPELIPWFPRWSTGKMT